MCGLAGMASPDGFIEADFRFFKELLKISCMRGYESTGVFSYEKENSEYEVRKRCIPSPGFVDAMGHVFLKNKKANIYMGHTRWSTAGVNKESNAHPFDTEKYVAAHNGTLHDWEFNKKSNTDSEQMFNKMDEEGVKPVLDKIEYYSAFAVSMFEKSSCDLLFARNEARDLYFGVHPERNLFCWASDKDFIHFASRRANLKDFVVYKVSEFLLFRVRLDSIKAGEKCWTTESIKKPKVPKSRGLTPGDAWAEYLNSKYNSTSTLYDSKGNVLSSTESQNIVSLNNETQRLVDEYMVDKVQFTKKYPNLIDSFGNLSMSNVKTLADLNDALPF